MKLWSTLTEPFDNSILLSAQASLIYRLKSRVKVWGWTWLGNINEDDNFAMKCFNKILVVVFTWLEGKYFMLRFMMKRETSNISSISFKDYHINEYNLKCIDQKRRRKMFRSGWLLCWHLTMTGPKVGGNGNGNGNGNDNGNDGNLKYIDQDDCCVDNDWARGWWQIHLVVVLRQADRAWADLYFFLHFFSYFFFHSPPFQQKFCWWSQNREVGEGETEGEWSFGISSENGLDSLFSDHCGSIWKVALRFDAASPDNFFSFFEFQWWQWL